MVFHRAGQVREKNLSYYHDAGIVKLADGEAYVLIILTRAPFTKEKNLKDIQVEAIRDISRIALETILS